MIKINLLPRTINEKLIIRNMAIGFGLLLVLVIAGGIGYGQVLRGQVEQEEQLATETEALQKQVEGIEAQTSEVMGSIKPIQDKVDFIKNVRIYNGEYPKLYAEIAKWTYEKVTYLSLQCDGTQVAMQARVKGLDDLGRFLLNMYQATDLFTEVSISGVPGYGSGQAGGQPGQATAMDGQAGGPQGGLAGIGAIQTGVDRGPVAGGNYIEFTVMCKLKKPIVAPSFAGAAGGAGGAPGAPGAPGMGGAMPMAPPPPAAPSGGPPAS